MVRTQTLPFLDYARATSGQLTWTWLNVEADWIERKQRVHAHCLPKLERNVCEICQEPVITSDQIPVELRDKVYKPNPGETYHADVEFNNNEIKGVS